MKGTETRRSPRARTCRGGAGVVAELPGIRGDACERTLAHAFPAILGGGGFAEDDRTGVFEPTSRMLFT